MPGHLSRPSSPPLRRLTGRRRIVSSKSAKVTAIHQPMSMRKWRFPPPPPLPPLTALKHSFPGGSSATPPPLPLQRLPSLPWIGLSHHGCLEATVPPALINHNNAEQQQVPLHLPIPTIKPPPRHRSREGPLRPPRQIHSAAVSTPISAAPSARKAHHALPSSPTGRAPKEQIAITPSLCTTTRLPPTPSSPHPIRNSSSSSSSTDGSNGSRKCATWHWWYW